MQTSVVNKSTRNNSIDIFRFIAAILVVSVHTDPLLEIHPMLHYLAAQVMSRIAVPFFFAVSGYYCTVKLDNGSFDLWKHIRRLLIPYSLWTAIYFVFEVLVYGVPDILEWLISFFTFGSVYHFWTFPGMIISACMLKLLFKKEKLIMPLGITLAVMGCLFHGYYRFGSSIPLLSAINQMEDGLWVSLLFFLGIPSFFLGYFINRTIHYWTNSRRIALLFFVSFVMFLAEIVVLKVLDWSSTVTQTAMLFFLIYFLMVWLIRHPMPGKEKLSNKCRLLANATYYSHVMFINIFMKCNALLFGSRLTTTYQFLFVCTMSLILGLLLASCKGKYVKAVIS